MLALLLIGLGFSQNDNYDLWTDAPPNVSILTPCV